MPVSVSISIDEGDAISMLQAAVSGLQDAINAGLEKAAVRVQQIAQGLAPVRTGALRASITYEVGDMEATITATAPYAHFVEFGRGEVSPRTAKVLHWDEVFTMHAGPAAPRPFMRPAAQQAAGLIQSSMAEAVALAFEG